MADERLLDIVNRAAGGEYDLPELQRGFVWRRDQVFNFCDSVYREYPVGMLLLWDNARYIQPRAGEEARRRPLWIVDGQQRITSACLLFGKKPYWMAPGDWASMQRRFRVFVNIQEGNNSIKFGPEVRDGNWTSLPVNEILAKRNADEVARYVLDVVNADNDRFRGLIGPVNQVWNLQNAQVSVIRMDGKEPEEVAEIFERFNLGGTRLKETDVRLALISVFNQGWVRDRFHPFLEDLEEDGWAIPPGYLLQAMTVANLGRARMREVPDDFWQNQVQTLWDPMARAISQVLTHLWDKGIPTLDLLPSAYTLIPLFAMHARFSERPGYSFDDLYRWFLLTNMQGRYSGAPLETLTIDAQRIHDARNLQAVLGQLPNNPPPTEADLIALFREPFRKGSFPTLLLHLILWERDAHDWLLNISVRGQSQARRRGGRGGMYQSHWHHILPKGWARRNAYDQSDTVSNVTLLTQSTNVRRLSARAPWDYVPRNNISQQILEEHFLPQNVAHEFVVGNPLSVNKFHGFLNDRAQLLARAASQYLGL